MTIDEGNAGRLAPAATVARQRQTAGTARPRASGRAAEGVFLRHRRHCAGGAGEACSCSPGYQAQAWSARDGKPVRRTFPTLAQAKAWRQEAQVALRRGQLQAPTKTLLGEAAEEWLQAARAGVVRTRSGDRYKPSAIRAYQQALNAHLLPALGQRRLSAITRPRIQQLIDDLVAGGAAPSTVRNAVLPLRAIFRRALTREQVALNPTVGLALPAVRARRERVARPQEAAALVGALPDGDCALWATALYAGLRRGELQALRWRDVDLEANVIRVERSWDAVAGPVEPKSRSGRRRVPLGSSLRRHLLAHRLRSRASPEALVFGTRAGRAFDPASAAARARAAWAKRDLAAIGLHECRHTYAAFMIAAGVNAKALSVYMGHSSITVTLDRYGHLMPGSEAEAAHMLDAYLAAAAQPGERSREPAAARRRQRMPSP